MRGSLAETNASIYAKDDKFGLHVMKTFKVTIPI